MPAAVCCCWLLGATFCNGIWNSFKVPSKGSVFWSTSTYYVLCTMYLPTYQHSLPQRNQLLLISKSFLLLGAAALSVMNLNCRIIVTRLIDRCKVRGCEESLISCFLHRFWLQDRIRAFLLPVSCYKDLKKSLLSNYWPGFLRFQVLTLCFEDIEVIQYIENILFQYTLV